jgi:hypothetical protein
MKKLLLLASATALAGFAAAPAFATTGSATGTVTVNGSVAAKCNLSSTTPQTIELGELAQSNGTVVSSLPANSVTFSVECTSPNPGLSVSATALNNAGGTAATGYTNTVHYTATLQANAASGTDPAALTYTTADTPPAASTESVGGPLKNAPANITISVSNPHTSTATDLLESSSTDGYTGTITFTVSPS